MTVQLTADDLIKAVYMNVAPTGGTCGLLW